MTPYNGNASNVPGSTATISTPQDGDSFTAANDNARTNTLADWAQRFVNYFLGITAVPAGMVITAPTPTVMTPLLNGWVNPLTYGHPPRYWKDAFGVVHLDGSVNPNNAASANQVFVLPVGFRPAALGGANTHRVFPSIENEVVGSASTLSEVHVFENGSIVINWPTGANTAGDYSLEGITFPTF